MPEKPHYILNLPPIEEETPATVKRRLLKYFKNEFNDLDDGAWQWNPCEQDPDIARNYGTTTRIVYRTRRAYHIPDADTRTADKYVNTWLALKLMQRHNASLIKTCSKTTLLCKILGVALGITLAALIVQIVY